MIKSIQSVRNILAQMNVVLNGEQKSNAVKVFVCMIGGAVLELVGVSAIYPFLQMMLSFDVLQEKWYVKWIYYIWPDIEATGILLFLGGIIIIVYIFKNLFMILSAYVQHSYAAKFQCEVSTRMLHAYLKRPYQFFLNVNSGALIRGITTDIQGVYQILLNFFTLLAELLTVSVLGVFLIATDWSLALSAMVLMVFCFLAIVLGFKGKMRVAGKDLWDAYALKNQYGYQAINGIKEITVLDRRENFVKKYNEAALLEQKSAVTNGFIGVCPDRILEGVCIGGFMGIVCIKIAIGKDLETFIPVLGTFAMGAFRMLPSIAKISNRINSIIYFHPSLENVYDNLNEIRKYEEIKNESELTNNIKNEKIRFVSELKVKNINWKYENSKNDTLHNASLYIKKGESIAFIGTSGAGKTTLADIVMGLLKPQEGEVEMDGIDIFTIPHQWSKIIGYVPQSIFLIDDTVRNNIAFGLEQEKISDQKVWEALEQAQLKEFVKNLPKGLDTMVGERGVKLSGGQRQRIAIARALYENPDILILDEATSALDSETETAVMESISALQGFKTLIIVAHRLTTIKNCDRIYEIENGTVLEKKKEQVLGLNVL